MLPQPLWGWRKIVQNEQTEQKQDYFLLQTVEKVGLPQAKKENKATIIISIIC